MTPSSNNLLLSMVQTRRPVLPWQKRKAGRKKFQETRHPVYKGVRRRNGKWVCELRQPHTKRRIWFGTFPCPKMAARAHDVAAWALKGESSSLNFPEAAYSLPPAKSGSIEYIQVAAMELSADDHNKKIKCTSTITTDTSCDQGSRRRLFVDEDEVFNMPALIDSMAEGLILTPPALKRGFNWCGYIENEAYMDLTLWTD